MRFLEPLEIDALVQHTMRLDRSIGLCDMYVSSLEGGYGDSR